MKVVILCGGKGLRYSSDKPKGLALVAGIPIIQRVMNIYYLQGHNDFLLILGYKGKEIEDYFKNLKKYKVKFEYIEEGMNKGGALFLAKEHCLNEQDFFCTYCDCIADVDLNRLCYEHIALRNVATLTAIRPYHDVGILTFGEKYDQGKKIVEIREKPQMNEWANGGFFVFNRSFFEYIYRNSDDLETDIFGRLVKEGKLGGYKHNGKWNTINTPKDEEKLNKLYEEIR